MSRSYKHTAYYGEHKGKEKKRLANHKVRQKLKDLDFECQHMAYKNVGMDRWDMRDFYWMVSWKEYYKRSKSNNYKETYRLWYKHYKMK